MDLTRAKNFSQSACLILRGIEILGDKASTQRLAEYVRLGGEEVLAELLTLGEQGVVTKFSLPDNTMSRWEFHFADAQSQKNIAQAVTWAQDYLTKQRLAKFPIDVVGRLTWIDDMAEMINFARENNSQLKAFQKA